MSERAQDLFEATQLREWRSSLMTLVVAVFLIEAITGLVIYFGPFSVSGQVMVLVHTLLGLVLVVPYAVYQWRHWLTNRPRPLNQHKLLGYLAFGAVAVAGISGVVLSWQAAFGSRIGYLWDLAHLVSGLLATAFVAWHVVVILLRHGRQDRSEKADRMRAAQDVFVRRVAWGLVACAVALAAWTALSPSVPVTRAFPADYQLPFGDNPFAPSLATTATGGALEPSLMGQSEKCGVAGCHAEIVEEWLPSAHRYAAMSPFFAAVQDNMAANNGPESTRYCGGCHDPIALFSGSKNLYSDDLSAHGYQEGLSCVACHSIERTDVRGNADFVMAAPPRYLYENSDDGLAAWVSNFLIRAYPRQHVKSWTRDLYKTPEYCGACHKQFIDAEINNVGWVQLQNQYDNWKQSRWHREQDPEGTVSCRECHMPLVDSLDPAAGDSIDYNRSDDDGKHRSHEFLGANQYLPTLLGLPGADRHVERTEQWLRGEIEIPEIADKWTRGPAVPIEIVSPATVAPGEPVKFQVVAVNNKAGHDFPTGPLDIIQAWIEVEVRDPDGDLVFRSGGVDDEGFLEGDATIFKAEAIDQFGNLIDKHNLWEMVGARFKRTLFPGYSDVASYTFDYPESGAEQLQITARLRYRKVDQYLTNFLFPGQGLTAHITDMSTASARITAAAVSHP